MMNQPIGIDISSDGAFALVTEYAGNRIRKITLAGGVYVSSLIAGQINTAAGTSGSTDGVGSTASFLNPQGIIISSDMTFALVVDRGNSKIRKINLLTYTVTSLVTAAGNTPISIAWGGLQDLALVTALNDNKINKLSYPSGTYAVIAGSGSATDSNNVGTLAGIYTPHGLSIWKCSIPGMGIDTNSALCQLCSAGKYSNNNGLCIPCPSGFSSAVGSASVAGCVQCLANTYSAVGVGCVACPVNTWSSAGAGSCTANAGYYNLASSLMAYYPFNSNNLMTDTTGKLGNLYGTPCSTMPTPSTSVVPYTGGQSLNFVAASSQTINMPAITLPDPYTVCLYHYLSTTPAGGVGGPAFFQFASTPSSTDWAVFYDNGYGENYYRFRESSGNQFIGDITTPGGSLLTTTWAHYCLSWNGQQGSIWTNGVPTVVNAVPAGGTLKNRNVIQYTSNFLGSVNWGGPNANFLNGYLDEFMIFNRALSNADVQYIYNMKSQTGLPVLFSNCTTTCSGNTYLHCTPTGTAVCCGAGTYFVENVSTACQTCAAGTYGYGNVTACIQCPANTYSTSGAGSCTACPANSWSAGGASACTANAGYYDLGSSLMAYYPFNPSNIVADVSGKLGPLTNTGGVSSVASTPTPQNGWAGGSQNSAYLSQPGGVSSSNSQAQYLSLPSISVPSATTICAWYYPKLSGQYNRIFDFALGAGPNSDLMAFVVAGTSNLECDAYLSTTKNPVTVTNAWTLNSWQHLCFVVSGATSTVYYNGATSGSVTGTITYPGYTYPTDSAWIGKSHWAADDLYTGYFDEFRVYNRALTAAEITAIYNFRGDTYTPVLPLTCTPSCSAGTYGHCTPTGTSICCGAGTYFAEGTSIACQQCVAGTYGYGNTTACPVCPANTYSGAGAGVCTACPANTGSSPGSKGCLASTGYYLGSGAKFPPSGMTSATMTMGSPSETFSATASSWWTNAGGAAQQYGAFSATTADWTASAGGYSATGAYTANAFSTVVDGTVYWGEWIQLQTGNARPLGPYSIQAHPSIGARTPGSWIIAGSNDGVVWTLLDSSQISAGLTWTASQIRTFIPSPPISRTFTYFRLIELASAGDSFGGLDEWMLYAAAPTTCSATGCTSGVTYPQCSTSGSTVCCWAGTYWSPSATVAGCTACAAGTYGIGNSTSCSSCAAGTYAAVAGSSVCTACAAGTSSLAGSSNCPLTNAGCAAGTYIRAGTTVCAACPPNSWSVANAANCTANTGYYDLGTDLLAYYPFNPDQLLKDISGKTGSLTAPKIAPVADCTTPASGPGGNWASNCVSAMQGNLPNVHTTDATAQYYSIPSFTPAAAGFSVCMWYQATPTALYATNADSVFGFCDSSSSLVVMEFYRYATSETQFNFIEGNNAAVGWDVNYVSNANNDFKINTWNHMCFTISGTSYAIYVNGALRTSGTASNPFDIVTSRSVNYLFAMPFNGQYGFQGKIDEFRMYNRALKAAEVTAIYNFQGDSYTTVFPVPISADPGQYVLSGVLTACPGGYFCTGGLTQPQACTVCQAGTYIAASCTASTDTNCVACVAGSNYSTTTSAATCTTCDKCIAGQYVSTTCTATANIGCGACVSGTSYSTANNTGSCISCSLCSAGQYVSSACTTTSNIACSVCPAGSYCPSSTTSTVIACSAGTYSTGTGMQSSATCTSCVAGSYSSGVGMQSSATCTNCGAGTYSTGLGMQSVATCTNCIAGKYSTGTGIPTSAGCTGCVAGTYSTGLGMQSAATCSGCSVGTYSSGIGMQSSATCSACSPGTYASSSGTPTCLTCSAGVYASGSSATNCVNCTTTCLSGQYISTTCTITNNISCTQCPLGSYCSNPATTTVQPCGTGQYCAAGSTSPQQCAAGFYCPNASSQIACSSGYYCPQSSTSPQLCVVGNYCPNTTSQIMCDAKNYCPAGSTSQSLCPQDFYCALPSTKVACTSTYYCPAGSTTLTLCAAGSYCPDTHTQTACTLSNYCPAGSIAQNLCQLGSYCPDTQTQTACSSGSYCASGSTAPSTCPVGFYCSTPSVKTACPANSYCLSGVTTYSSCTVCTPGFYTSTTCTSSINAVCTGCSSGVNYASTSNASACTTCGTCYSSQYVSSVCTASANITCATCPLGSYCASPLSTTVTACSPGQFCPAGSTAPQQCVAGFYCPNASAQIACPAGSFCLAGSSAPSTCAVCAAGTYRSAVCTATANTVCPSCTGGSTFSLTTNTASCTSCNTCSGQFVSNACTVSSDAVCSACPAGSFCPNSSAVVPCDLGNYCPSGSTSQSPCAAGSVCTTPATQIACNLSYYCPPRTTVTVLCAAGSYCSNTSSQIPCQSSNYCPAGSTSQNLCPLGSACATPSSSVSCDTFAYGPVFKSPPKPRNSIDTVQVVTFLGQAVDNQNFVLDSTDITSGIGSYSIYWSSSAAGNENKYSLFDQSLSSGTFFATNNYPSGVYSGSNYIVSSFKGDWVVIKFPNPFVLTGYGLGQNTNWLTLAPRTFKLYGSVDGVTFTEITQASKTTAVTFTGGVYNTTVNPESVAYNYVGIVVDTIFDPVSMAALGFTELWFYGKEKSITPPAPSQAITCPAGSTASIPCPVGSFCPDSKTVTLCVTPYYCPLGSPSATLCAAGYYCPSPSSQIACPANQYCLQGVITGTNCSTCVNGQYIASICTASANIVCPVCTNLPANAAYTGVGSAVNNCPWVCNQGYYLSGGQCLACPPGSWCSANVQNTCPTNSNSTTLSYSQNSCLCKAGYFGNGSITGTSPCPICNPGSFCPGGNNNVSIACPANFSSPVGSSSYSDCQCIPGYLRVSNSSCQLCAAGQICISGVLSTCPTNSLAPQGSSSASDCVWNPGFYGPNGGTCTQCPANSYCPGGNVITSCTANAVSPPQSTNATACYCDRGYQGIANAPCAACPPNTWCWTGVLNNCPANTYSPALSSWWVNCTCVPGFTGSDGSACTPCVAGTYKIANGSAVCSQCPANAYCPQGSVNPTVCPLNNSNSPAGSISLSQCQCNPGYYGAQCSPCPVTAYCPGGSLALPCPNSGYTSAVAASDASQCICPGNATVNGSGICECVGGYRHVVDANSPATWRCDLCSASTYCTGGVAYTCPTGSSATAPGASNFSSCICTAPAYLNVPYNGSVTQCLSSPMSAVGFYQGCDTYVLTDDQNSMLWTVGISKGVFGARVALAGGGTGAFDGTGTGARFSNPSSVAMSPDGSFALVGDYSTCIVRKVFISNQTVSTVAGLSSSCSSTVNGVGSAARFTHIFSMAYIPSSGSLYLVGEEVGQTVRIYNDTSRSVTTIATMSNAVSGLVATKTTAYVSCAGAPTVWAIDLKTYAVTTWLTGLQGPVYGTVGLSPDYTRAVIPIYGDKLLIVDIATKATIVTVVDSGNVLGGLGYETSPVYSPDGAYIYVWTHRSCMAIIDTVNYVITNTCPGTSGYGMMAYVPSTGCPSKTATPFCASCPASQYCPAVKIDCPNCSCTNCPANKYYLTNFQCGTCPVNSTSPAGTPSIGGCTCIDGTYAINNNTATQQCSACPPGFFCQGGFSTPCPADSYCVGNTITPVACPVLSTAPLYSNSSSACLCGDGYYMSGNVCLMCGYGTYASKGAVGACKVCPSNSNTTWPGASLISQCLCIAGYTGDNNALASPQIPYFSYLISYFAFNSTTQFLVDGSSSNVPLIASTVPPVFNSSSPFGSCWGSTGLKTWGSASFNMFSPQQLTSPSNQFFKLPSYNLGQYSTGFSICLWFQPNNFKGTWESLMLLGKGVRNTNIMLQRDGATDGWQFSTFLGNWSPIVEFLVLPNQWAHVSIVYFQSNFYFYLNATLQGQFLSSSAWPNTILDQNTLMDTNWWGSGIAAFSGNIAEFRVYSKGLSQSDVTDIYNWNPCATGCATCKANSYCPGNKTNYTVTCPNSTYSTTGASTVGQCTCPANSAWLPSLNCTCNNGTYKVSNAAAPLGGWQCDACVAGNFCQLGVSNQCPSTFYCPSSTSNPIPCPDGSFCVASSSAPTTCVAGNFCKDGISTACPIQFYCPASASAPTPCPDGSFCLAGVSTPTTCPAGKFCKNGTATPCPVGSFCVAGASAPTPCPPGSYCLASVSAPVTCPPGSYCQNGIATSCPAGSFCSANSSSPTPCPPGSFCLASASAPVTCSPGFYCQNGISYACPAQFYCPSGAPTPTACPQGSYCLASVAAPVTCDSGYFCQNGVSYPCPAQFFCPSGAANATACPDGAVCVAGSSAPVTCAAGSFCLNGVAVSCPSGSYCAPGVSVAVSCPFGYFCAASATGPASCPSNSNTSSPGAVTITECKCNPGFYGPDGGNCTQCPANSFCGGGNQISTCPTGLYSLAQSSILSQCSCPTNANLIGNQCLCSPGLMSIMNPLAPLGGWECDPCPAKKMCINGSASLCPPGSFCVNGVATQCPVNTYCAEGSTATTACPAFSSSAAGSAVCTCADGYAFINSSLCAQCAANHYCIAGIETACPPGSQSPVGSPNRASCACLPGFYSSAGACVECLPGSFCAGGSIMSNTAIEVCPAGTFCPAQSSTPTSCTSIMGSYCPANSSAASPCPAGFYCLTLAGPLNICPSGAYCASGSTAPSSCPANTYSTDIQQTNISACKACTVCVLGSLQLSPCSATANRVCETCWGKPQFATYRGSACSWVCNDGYAGDQCTQCLPGYWCASGISNQCPLYSSSLTGAKTQNDCTCNPGYTSQGSILGTSPCVQCSAGSICPGGGVVQVTISPTVLTNVEVQVMLVQQPLPPADNLVSLFTNVPANLAAIQATVPAGVTVYTRQVCRGTYCVSCDGSANCVPLVWIGVSAGPGGRFTFNVTSVKADTLVKFVTTTPQLCTPSLNLPLEYQTGTTVFVSSISTISSIPVYCPTNALIANSLPVVGTTSAIVRRRRLLENSRHLLATASDALAVSLVVPANATNTTQSAVSSANLTIQGYSPITPPNRQIVVVTDNSTSYTTNSSAPLSCPANSTSPPGSVSVTQCVCLPGYKGNAAAGTPCAPCEAGVFCSGGLIGLCPSNATAPPMSNSSAECTCNPGFYGASSCTQCPQNAFCLGGSKYSNCSANAISPAQSTSDAACYCSPGYVGVKNQPCQPCSPGFWCWTGVSNQCPLNMTSNASATRASSCFCKDGYQSVVTKDASGATTAVCTLCQGDTYCKVSTASFHIYNTHPPVFTHA